MEDKKKKRMRKKKESMQRRGRKLSETTNDGKNRLMNQY